MGYNTFMTELTKQDLEKSLKNVATKDDLKNLATKDDVKDAVEDLARIVNTGFDNVQGQLTDISKKLDQSEQIKVFEQKFKKLEEALHIKL